MIFNYEKATRVTILLLALRAMVPAPVSVGFAIVFVALVVFSLLTQTKPVSDIQFPKEEFEGLKNKVSAMAMAMGMRKLE